MCYGIFFLNYFGLTLKKWVLGILSSRSNREKLQMPVWNLKQEPEPLGQNNKPSLSTFRSDQFTHFFCQS